MTQIVNLTGARLALAAKRGTWLALAPSGEARVVWEERPAGTVYAEAGAIQAKVRQVAEFRGLPESLAPDTLYVVPGGVLEAIEAGAGLLAVRYPGVDRPHRAFCAPAAVDTGAPGGMVVAGALVVPNIP